MMTLDDSVTAISTGIGAAASKSGATAHASLGTAILLTAEGHLGEATLINSGTIDIGATLSADGFYAFAGADEQAG